VSAILGIQATKEADATAAREAQLRAEAEAHAQQQAEARTRCAAGNPRGCVLELVNNYRFPPAYRQDI
jgi:hypothetical protein